jgi:hypothetical protein
MNTEGVHPVGQGGPRPPKAAVATQMRHASFNNMLSISLARRALENAYLIKHEHHNQARAVEYNAIENAYFNQRLDAQV